MKKASVASKAYMQGKVNSMIKKLSMTTSAANSSNTGDDSASSSSNGGSPMSAQDFSTPQALGGNVPKKLFVQEEKQSDKLVGVVVTICSGSSYDPMFSEVQPVTVEGERVSTYSISCEAVEDLHSFLTAAATPTTDMWRSVVSDIQAVAADSVVFNWECCSCCGDRPFPRRGASGRLQRRTRAARPADVPQEEPSVTMRFMGYAVGAGFTIMCSDFSLKSLIHEWSTDCLGPNPFKVVGSCDDQFVLEFVPQELQNDEVPQQLQVVGELCAAEGKAVVNAMSDTIAYTVKRDREHTDMYDLKVLTVVTSDGEGVAQGLDHFSKCEAGAGDAARIGSAGHVTLTYRSGGQLVTSNGHWIELTRINTSMDAVLAVAKKNYGSREVEDFELEYATKSSASEQAECVQKRARKMVQQSVSTRMKCRTKY